MPELFDIEIYLAAFRERVAGSALTRNVEPLLAAVDGVFIAAFARLGKLHCMP